MRAETTSAPTQRLQRIVAVTPASSVDLAGLPRLTAKPSRAQGATPATLARHGDRRHQNQRATTWLATWMGQWMEQVSVLAIKSNKIRDFLILLAEGVGFEPTIRLPVYTLSKRAPSA